MPLSIDCEQDGLYTRNPDVVLRDEDAEGALLFNPDSNQILVLNATGVKVWKTCDGTREIKDIVAAIKADFAVAQDATVDEDVDRFLREMFKGGFLGRQQDSNP